MLMPKFSQPSFSKLSTCHIDLQVLFFEVIKYVDCIILEGYRNQEDQEKAFAAGNTKLHWPNGKHNHQPSMAVDVTTYPIDFKNEKLAIWFGGYVLGIAQKLKDEGKMTHGVRWGGAWDGLGKLDTHGQLQDPGHFELIS
jgi:peptidoglycan L-alanyl-D-glutamate endopeptidase CwlK